MDLVKQEIMNKRKALAEEGGGKRYFKRSEIEQKRLQKVREEEKRELEEKKNHQPQPTSSSLLDLIFSAKSNTDASTKTVAITAEEQSINELDLSKQEVIRRLRLLKQPITVFGEDDEARLDRLKTVLKTGTFEVDNDMTEGQTNDFLRDMVELKKRQKSGMMGDRKRKSEDLEDGEGGKGDDDLSGEGASSGVDADKDIKLMKAKFEDLCEEDKIWCSSKRLLNEWNQELNEKQDLERRTAKGKQMVATFKQCARYLTPLFKFCRKRALPDDIKKALMVVVNCWYGEGLSNCCGLLY
ncbi:Pre-mRNA-splicing factor 18 [Bienertia sinuspersici]